tara:strand:- start:20940 stop:22790 length:1851 start_codon:yes stop_codon:yes gene_type:complete
MGDNRNFLIAILLSIGIFVGWQHFVVNPRIEAEKARQDAIAAQTAAATGQTVDAQTGVAGATGTRLPDVSGIGNAKIVPTVINRGAALNASPRITIASGELDGSIALKGARFDDLSLRKYRETVDKTSPEVTLLSPSGTDKPYFSELGFIAAPGSNVKLPDANSVWSLVSGDKLTPETPVTLSFDNGQGLVFLRTISLDEHFLFTIVDTVKNTTGNAVTLYPYGLISRTGQPESQAFYILHEGFIGEFKEYGEETIKYATAIKDAAPVSITDTEGWIGITDKYWATTLVPQAGQKFVGRFSATPGPNGDVHHEHFQADYRYDAMTVPAGSDLTLTNHLFAGAKVSKVIDSYRDQGIFRFNLLIDWGYFWFLTQPVFKAIDLIAHATGNFGIAILIITVLIKLAFFPLANRSYESMSKMKKLQPRMEELRDRHKEDKMAQQQAIMALYKEEKVNPIAGCLPILIQIPVFFALYKVLFVTIEMRHAPFFGWIHDLSAPDPTTIFNLFGLIPWDPTTLPLIGTFLALGVWPLLMGFTMFVQQRMNPAPADPIQQQIFLWMPVLFTFMLASFPAGLVIYWAWNNTLSVLQQGVIMRRQGVPIEIFSNLGIKKKPAGSEKS